MDGTDYQTFIVAAIGATTVGSALFLGLKVPARPCVSRSRCALAGFAMGCGLCRSVERYSSTVRSRVCSLCGRGRVQGKT